MNILTRDKAIALIKDEMRKSVYPYLKMLHSHEAEFQNADLKSSITRAIENSRKQNDQETAENVLTDLENDYSEISEEIKSAFNESSEKNCVNLYRAIVYVIGEEDDVESTVYELSHYYHNVLEDADRTFVEEQKSHEKRNLTRQEEDHEKKKDRHGVLLGILIAAVAVVLAIAVIMYMKPEIFQPTYYESKSENQAESETDDSDESSLFVDIEQTDGYRRYVKKLLKKGSFSKEETISKAVEHVGGTRKFAKTVISHMDIDWKVQAAENAKELYTSGDCSTQKDIEKVLEYDHKFTHKEAVYGAKHYKRGY